jgi:hypothetical protein
MKKDFVPRRNWSRGSDNSHHLIGRWREFPGLFFVVYAGGSFSDAEKIWL